MDVTSKRLWRRFQIALVSAAIGFGTTFLFAPVSAWGPPECPHTGCWWDEEDLYYECVYSPGTECELLTQIQCTTSLCKDILQ